MRLTRRAFLKLAGGLAAIGAALAAWGVVIEPMLLTRVTRYKVTPPGWPPGLKLTAAVLADIHACRPWMTPERIGGLVERTNGLGADVILLLGDYVSGMRLTGEPVEPTQWAGLLSGLSAPLGVHAVLGNHDWWEDLAAQARGAGPTVAHGALQAAGIPVYENDTVRLEKDGQAFWLAGLGDQLALRPGKAWNRERFTGVDDLDATLKKTGADEPVILMAHEPDIFPDVPQRVSLTLSGHTHGGQVRLFGWSPVVPSRFGNRFAYGHVVEEGRHLIVSGGLGFSIFPVRFGVRPEIVLIEIG